MERASWDDYFFGIAAKVAERATCPRASIGALLARGHHIIGTGYNGVASGLPHCPDTPEHLALDHCRDAIHAEINALTNALIPAYGATLYVVGPRQVCPNCADRLREQGVSDIRWQQSVPTLATVLDAVLTWQRATFPTETLAGKIAHLREEVDELAERPECGEEMADVLMLLHDIANLAGVDLTFEVARKLGICRTRTWGAPDADGKIKAVKEVAR